ncbi:hypothetical protein L228DRAFT_246706 [Xylona heveae TC161]|uniref:Transcription initiation factor IIF subunit beta n=1 Tax=Xylona heveae (strain CBS 132557 / TC161) TaxID=1328760 RepID=A0A165HR21_XYLHT|nr:hypothetical protein L228DRAFT_246706 [Xylona heveae TC161]KZF23855.1 hypothetical protein L228DRAFT_246706 [Xylona heveae TC161]
MATNGVTVKTEPGVEPRIKPDPDSAEQSPVAFEDEDIYEDAGDLDFSHAGNPVWLMRIPKILWENWSNIGDDEEIQIGTVRLEGTQQHVNRLSLLLSSELEQNRDVPKEYNLRITNESPANTYVFTEKDLPGYASKVRSGRPVGDRLPPSSRPETHDRRYGKDRGKRWEPYYRKAIPKQTAMVGQVQHEVNCLPVENEESRNIMERWTLEKTKPKRETKFLSGNVGAHGGNLLQPGTLGAAGNFGGFIKTTGPQKARAQEQKAARIPQNELLDLIYRCFQRYNYWSIRSLRAELNQPEAYLKQTLEKVAMLVRQGPFAMTWTLKPEAKESTYANAESYTNVKNEIAPDAGFEGGSDMDEGDVGDEDDDENIKMEDVLP